MISGPIIVDRRRLLTVLVLGLAGFFLVTLLVPASPGFLRPGSWAALAIGLVNACLLRPLTEHQDEWEWLPLLSGASMTAGLGLAAANSGPGQGCELFLLWFPWLAAFCGMLRLGSTLALAAWIALVMILAAWANPDLADPMPLLVAAVVSSVCGCLVMSGLFRWGHQQAFSDPLTSLVARSGLASVADPAIARARERGEEVVFLLLDINRFREVNDALGHEGGDELLRQFARALTRVRPRPAFVGRLGSDEFALVISCPAGTGDPIGAPDDGARQPPGRDRLLRDLGSSVLRQVEGPFEVRGINVGVEASAGLALAPRDGETAAALLPCADVALSRAKRQGERVGLWDVGIAGVRSWEISLYAELRAAITRNELLVYYQPLQSAATGQIVGVEALVRWRHPTRGLLPPGAFLPIAERSALIGDMTRWVLDEALRQCADWAARGLHVPVSVNLSARMLILDDLPDLVTTSLARHHLPPDMLTLEITESALVTQPGRAAAMLRELRSKGVKLALDDFGTGYSSMEILKALPFDEVKIDRGFVADIRGSLQDAAIVRSVLDLGHRLGLRVVGEGVEDERTLRMMSELGCDILQGDVISRPRPPSRLEDLLAVRAARTDRPATGPGPAGQGGPGSAGARRAGSEPTATHPSPGGPLPLGSVPNGSVPNGSGSGGPVPGGSTAVTAGLPGTTAAGPGEAAGGAAAGGAAEPRQPDRTLFTLAQTQRFGILAPLAQQEAARVAAVRRYEIAFRPHSYLLDDVAALAAAMTGCDVGSIIIVSADSEIYLGRFGHQTQDIPARVGIGSHSVAAGELVEVPDATLDPRFAHGAKAYRRRIVRFVAGVPVRTSDGHAIGAITISDRIPRRLTPGQREALESLARHAMVMMDTRRECVLLELVTDTTHALDQLDHRGEVHAAASLITDTARHMSGADVANVLVADRAGSAEFTAVESSVAPGAEAIIRPGQKFRQDERTVVGQVLRTLRPLFVPDAYSYTGFNTDLARRSHVASVLIVPLPGAGGVAGALCMRWSRPIPVIDPALDKVLTLLGGQAGHALGRMLAVDCPGRAFETDSATGLATRSAFLPTLGHLPSGTAVCLFDLPWSGRPPPGAAAGTAPDQGLTRFATDLRAVADDPEHLARWADRQFVMAIPTGGREGAETAVAAVRRAWGQESTAPLAVGISITGGDEPLSTALIEAENQALAMAAARDARDGAGTPMTATSAGV
ncbi:EAL domain-containing protein [Frankia sp. Cpl3]|nr:EAL domain-containing protein [Frankia sp. Cpl3]